MVDESLFNPHFAGQDLLSYGYLPALGIGVPWTVYVLTLHVIWSIGAPVAVTEGLFGRPSAGREPVLPQVQAPWLGRPGLVLAVLGYLVGGTAVFVFTWFTSHFVASPAQLAGSVGLAAVLVAVGLRLPRSAPRVGGLYALGLVVGVVATTGFQLVRRLDHVSPWVLSLLLVAVLVLGGLVARAVRASPLGLGSGAVLTYGWLGFTAAAPRGTLALVEQSVLVLLALLALIVAWRRSQRHLLIRCCGRHVVGRPRMLG